MKHTPIEMGLLINRMCEYSSEIPHTVMDMSLYPQKCVVWWAISSAGIVGPVFVDGS
jgi:hypothetical protein